MPSVLELFTFVPQTERETELFNFDKKMIDKLINDLNNCRFYLGGQLKMVLLDDINLDSIKTVREISKKRMIEYGGPCNSFEAASIQQSNNELLLVENMIQMYNIIMEMREKLNK